MKHLFIPYELAVKAKEKGFNEPVFGFYTKFDQQLIMAGESHAGGQLVARVEAHNDRPYYLSAPLYQQIVDWFRDKYNLHIVVRDFLDDNDLICWDYSIEKVGCDVDEKGNYIPVVDYDDNRNAPDYYISLKGGIDKAFELLDQY